ncbi:putative 3'5'-cyclic phosphodiesterase pde-4 [Acanthocheilonema viteae]
MRTSFTVQKYDLNFHQFLKFNSIDFSSSATAIAVDAANSGNLKVGPSSGQHRRESFLYRPSIDEREFNRSASRTSSITSIAAQHGEDLIVTPFAQILASLRNVRNNLVLIANIPADENRPRPIPKRPPLHSTALPADVIQCGQDTLDELDWCLGQLETIQTHRSVSDMASSKFRKMLNKELVHFAESSKSGTQISQFLIDTYMDKDDDDVSQNLRVPDEMASTSSLDNVSVSLLGKAKTAAISRIIGIRKLKSPRGSHIPEYGVDGHKELEVYMKQLDEWGPNIFKIQEFSRGHSLTSITFTIMEKRGLLKTFEIPSPILLNYLLHLEHHYRDNPYHNQVHAADVTQSVNVLISSPALQNVFSELEVLASIFAGAIHDVDHPGFTNHHLINTNSELAIMYNDESVLEQHHLAVAFKLLQDSNCNFIVSLNRKQRQLFRKLTIEMVLATDMSKHMNILADLKTMVEAKKVAGSSVLTLDKTDRIQIMQTMIHLADLSNPTKPINLYNIWVKNIMEEYWRQGDRERDLGIDISPMCDRNNITIAKSQVGFIDFIVHPLFETWADLVNPHAQYILDQLELNREWYQARIPEEQEKQDVMIEENYANVEATTNFESSQHQQQQPSSTEITNLKQSESIKEAKE